MRGFGLRNKGKRIAAIVAPVYVNGVGVLRELARKGAHVVAADTYRDSPGLHSRLAGEKVLVPPPDRDPGSFARYLLSRKDLYGGLVVPTDDFFVRELYDFRRELEGNFRLCISSGQAVEVFLDKARTAAAAAEAGIETPRTRVVSGEGDLEDAARYVGFPALVKPVFSISFKAKFGKKSFVARERDELGAAVKKAADAGERIVIQEIIPGKDEDMATTVSYWNDAGGCAGEIEYRKVLQYPPFFGVGQLCRVARLPEVSALARRLLERLSYGGAVAATEFKWDARDGSWKLIEVNVRTPMQSALLRRAGCDLIDMMWRDKLGLPQVPGGKVRAGFGWAHEKNAILRHRAYPDERPSFREYLKSYRPPIMPALFELTDPGPFVADMWPLVKRRFSKKGEDAKEP